MPGSRDHLHVVGGRRVRVRPQPRMQVAIQAIFAGPQEHRVCAMTPQALRADGLVADVRGLGALWAVGVPDGVDPVAVRDRVLELGVFVRPIAPSTLAICPPLVIGDDDLDAVPAALRTALSP